ncbi:ceramide synthase 6-like isoform X2 [Alosa alosa]|uniref:ceramide synthase 6-like isoform X2 n=1 Tax=Alosa alosa TaxID=278164 RepID=UPI0020151D94|nr:ceramide synthase 6-like isoform X2 [Alosa alosa]
MTSFLAWFWNERFWLPHNVTWADLKNTDEAVYPQSEDLYLAGPLAFCIIMVRLLFERLIVRPLVSGLRIEVKEAQKAPPNAILDKVYTAITKHPDEKRLEGLSKQLDWDVRTIQRWFYRRRDQERPTTLARFCESMWKFAFYIYIFTYGVRYLKKTPWLHNTRECWQNYPNQPLTVEVHYYYLLELSFCLSLLVPQLADVKRKAAKMAKYARFKRFCNLLFLMFTLIFITSRLALYPAWVLKTTVFESWSLLGIFPSWWLLNGMLLLLLALHCLWAYLILRVTCRALSGPQGRKLNPLCVSLDNHHEVDFSSDEEEIPPHPKKPPHTSHRSQRNANGSNGAHRTNGYL